MGKSVRTANWARPQWDLSGRECHQTCLPAGGENPVPRRASKHMQIHSGLIGAGLAPRSAQDIPLPHYETKAVMRARPSWPVESQGQEWWLGDSHPLHEHGFQGLELIQHGRVKEGAQAPPVPAPHRLQSNNSVSGCIAIRFFMWGTQPRSCLPILFPLHITYRGLATSTARLWISALPQGWLQRHAHF